MINCNGFCRQYVICPSRLIFGKFSILKVWRKTAQQIRHFVCMAAGAEGLQPLPTGLRQFRAVMGGVDRWRSQLFAGMSLRGTSGDLIRPFRR